MKSLSALLWTVAAILFLHWLIGTVSQTTFGGLIDALLILIVAVVVIQPMRSRRTWKRRMTWVA